jgi:hypothetical protein
MRPLRGAATLTAAERGGQSCKAFSYTDYSLRPTPVFEGSDYSCHKRQTLFGAWIDWRTLMKTTAADLNPFSLMMEPELVLQTMERSQQLRGLRRHKLRPLDKPLIPLTKEAQAARAAFDAAIDAEDFEAMADAYLLN